MGKIEGEKINDIKGGIEVVWVRKELWLATNFATKMIKEDGNYNKAIKIASKYYEVEEPEVKEQISIRIGKGNKGKKRGSFKYWAIHGHMAGERYNDTTAYEKEYGVWHIVKALSEENALKQLRKNNDYSEYGSWFVHGDVYKFSNRDNAEKFVNKNRIF